MPPASGRDALEEFMYGIYAAARTTVNETVDESVLKCRDQDAGYRPPGLERYVAR